MKGEKRVDDVTVDEVEEEADSEEVSMRWTAVEDCLQ